MRIALVPDMLSHARTQSANRLSLLPHHQVAAIGGGTGLPTVLTGLRQAATAAGDASSDWLTAIVTVMDDGGSSGRLRQTLGVLPPGDIRNCMAALVREPSVLSAIFHDRMPGHGADAGHPIGNLLLAALSNAEGNLLQAVRTLSAHLGVSGRVLPATLENVHLRAEFTDGEAVTGETAIAARHGRIQRLALERPVAPIPEVLDAIDSADLIVVGPGSLYTSILPNLLVSGVADRIARAKGTRVYVANLMTQPGETDGYSLGDHLRVLAEHTNHQLFDYVLANGADVTGAAVERYRHDGAEVMVVEDDERSLYGATLVRANLAAVTPGGEIRHDPAALGAALLTLAGASREGGGTADQRRIA